MKMLTSPSRQQGVSLVVTLVLVILLSLLALYGAGILVLDTRSSANDYRSREALTAAENGVEQAFSVLNVNRRNILSTGLDMNGDGDTTDANEAWTVCGTETQCTAIRSGDRANWKWVNVSALTNAPTQGSFTAYLMTPTSGESSLYLHYMVSIGQSADGQSTTIAKQGAFFYPIITAAPDVPIMSYGEIGGSGTWDVVTNPNGGGTGVPISAWSNKTVSLAGAGRTCNVGEFLSSNPTHTTITDSYGNTLTKCSTCSCPLTDYLSKNGDFGSDIVAPDPTFPTDPFKWLFGVPYTSYQDVKEEATILPDCSTLTTASNGLIWVTGACSINTNVGTFDKPVLLVVEDADFQMTGGGEFFGLVFVFKKAGYALGGAANVHLAGGTTLYGAIMTNDEINMGNGTYKMRFDPNVLANINRNLTARALSRITGSWSDVQQ